MAVTSPASTTATTSTTGTSANAKSTIGGDPMIASNFTTFLQLLTTQLKNQDPTSPMDTNQFTQQLVEFAQVEQQMKSNDQLSNLVALQSATQATTALAYVGAIVIVDGSNAEMTNSSATWDLNVDKPVTATLSIADSTGKTVYTGKVAVNPGGQQFAWDGIGSDGTQCPDGTYTLTTSAVDANNQPATISAEVQGKVDSVDLTQNPPVLSINGQSYTVDKLKRLVSTN